MTTDQPRVLMVAFHTPPARGASGVQRVVSFCRHLPELGWDPLLLTAHPRAYPQREGGGWEAALPPTLPVTRAFALDAKRHLAIGGRYSRLTALPDRYAAWWLGAVPAGLGLIRRERPALLWSTHPIATAHLVGATLARLSGLPWVADFRDPMVFDFYPESAAERWAYRRIEAMTLARAARVVVVTPGMKRYFLQRHPQLDPQRVVVIPNGHDPSAFAGVALTPSRPKAPGAPLTLLHSGHIYPGPGQRDPGPFLTALAALRRRNALGSHPLRVVFRGAGHEAALREMVAAAGVAEVVTVAPMQGYREALAEMAAADGLLLFQGERFNNQVPVKLFEYLGARRPILALAHPEGDSAAILREAGVGTLLAMDDPQAIAAGLPRFLARVAAAREAMATAETVARYSRRRGSEQLAGLLHEVMQAGGR